MHHWPQNPTPAGESPLGLMVLWFRGLRHSITLTYQSLSEQFKLNFGPSCQTEPQANLLYLHHMDPLNEGQGGSSCITPGALLLRLS